MVNPGVTMGYKSHGVGGDASACTEVAFGAARKGNGVFVTCSKLTRGGGGLKSP